MFFITFLTLSIFQYPYNRKGECNINITLYNNQNEISEFQQNIPFDTTIQTEDIFLLQESKVFKINSFIHCCCYEYIIENKHRAFGEPEVVF